ncbi:MAG: N-acetylmuramoyl-L-alanine amidase [Veillonellales bacterium]
MKIFINPGHAPNGEPDPGACNMDTGLRESDVTAAISEKVVEQLQTAGYEVQTLQSDSLTEVVNSANCWPADIFISIHCNACNSVAQGTETCVFSSYDAQLDYVETRARKLGECIQAQIVTALGTTDRGLKPHTPGKNGLYVLTETNMPAVLIETAFIDQEDDEKLLAERQDDFAAAIAQGVADYAA